MAPPSEAGSLKGTPTPISQAFIEIQQAIVQLQGHAQAASYAATTKISPPKKFDGTRGKLKTFLIGMEMYLRFNQSTFATEIDKVLAAGMHLEGEALEWFQPYMKDYFDNW